jgi:chromosome segregation ATPase
MADPAVERPDGQQPGANGSAVAARALIRPVTHKLRLTEAEDQTIRERAAIEGLSIAEYLRRQALPEDAEPAGHADGVDRLDTLERELGNVQGQLAIVRTQGLSAAAERDRWKEEAERLGRALVAAEEAAGRLLGLETELAAARRQVESVGGAPVQAAALENELGLQRRQIEALQSERGELVAQNAGLERRLADLSAEIDTLHSASPNEEAAELRLRIQSLTEHLATADRHVAQMRGRLDEQTGDARRQIATLETRLREREAELGGEVRRLEAAFAGETEQRQKQVAELTEANVRLTKEMQDAAAATARQRQMLESRVSTLLADIESLRTRHAEATADRERTIAGLRQEVEEVRAAASNEASQLRRAYADSEAARQREAARYAKAIEELKSRIAVLERDGHAARQAAGLEAKRLEAALAEERERARRLLDARDEERRKIEARAEAAEKQAAAATATATLEIAHAHELEMRLGSEGSKRADEIAALEQRIEALTMQLDAAQASSELVVDDLRIRLAALEGDQAAAAAVTAARQRSDALATEVEGLRARLADAEHRAERGAAMPESADTAALLTRHAAVQAQVAELEGHIHALETELGDAHRRLEDALATSAANAAAAASAAAEVVQANAPAPARSGFFGAFGRRGRGG